MIGHEQYEASVPKPAIEESVLAAARQQAVDELLRPNCNVVGVGIGKKVKDGQTTSVDCVRVYVVKKEKDKKKLPEASMVPAKFEVVDGGVVLGVVPTDVIEIERFGRRRHPEKKTIPNEIARPGARIRVRTNAPNINEGARGTVAAVLTDGDKRYLLGCNHLLAVNGRVPQNADLVLAEFVGDEPTIAEKMSYTYVNLHDGRNSVDCAMVQLPPGDSVPNTFPDERSLTSRYPICPKVDMAVTKYGAITNRTSGTIVDTRVDLYVDYMFGTFLFHDQVLIDGGDIPEHFATLGDSGSLVVEEEKKEAVAMIFAASGRYAVACPLQKVLGELQSKADLDCLELAV